MALSCFHIGFKMGLKGCRHTIHTYGGEQRRLDTNKRL